MNGPYVRRMIPELEDNDQAIQIILLGLPEEIYVVVDSCKTTQEIWLRVQQMMKGFDIGIQEKKAKKIAQLGMNLGHDKLMVEISLDRDLDEIEEVNENCILMANLQQTSTSGTQTDKALVYDLDKSAEVQLNDNCYNNDIFNMFTQEKQYIELIESITEPHQVPQNDGNVISKNSSVEQGGGTVK
nr:hypothetical protein [Tanacetum cinerariifolium]